MTVLGLFRRPRRFRVSLWQRVHRPPWGGGNQFMLALREALIECGVEVLENGSRRNTDAHILHGIWFDADAFRRHRARHGASSVVHRLDGIMSMYRADGTGKDQDDLCFALNREFATATVVQSRWVLDRIREKGHEPVAPVVVPNAASPRIFYPRTRSPLSTGRKVKLISTSWSQNANKGAAFYRGLESRLDWRRFEYTFVGNSAVTFEKIRHIPPVSSEELAELLREHDVFVTASRKEACSNALVEALSCGLPALYVADGSHAELVKQGGLPFFAEDEFLHRLEELVADYDRFRSCVAAPQMCDVARRYLAAAGFNAQDRVDE